jgi:glutathione S-transferase
MALQLFYHPFSSYCHKVLLALYENGTPFIARLLDGSDPAAQEEWARRWPMKRFPLLVADDRTIVEATIIDEYLDRYHPGPVRLIPDDPAAALEVRWMDRFFDNYISTPIQKLAFDKGRPQGKSDVYGCDEARAMLDTALAWLDPLMATREFAAGDRYSLADCGAATFLFYLHWMYPIDARHVHVLAYRARLMARPAMRRIIDEARPYRHLFPFPIPAGE